VHIALIDLLVDDWRVTIAPEDLALFLSGRSAGKTRSILELDCGGRFGWPSRRSAGDRRQ
jgi:hypothetical protein